MIVNDIITRSLRIINIVGIYETPDGAQSQVGLEALNGIISEWNTDGAMSTFTVKETFPLVQGQLEYTIGSGADFDTARPVKIISAFVSTSNVGRDLEELTYDQYDKLRLKDHSAGIPRRFFYNPTEPDGTIFIYPKPTVGYNITLRYYREFAEYDQVGDTVEFSTVYANYMAYALAEELSTYYGRVFSQKHVKLLNKYKSAIERINTGNMMPSIKTDVYPYGNKYGSIGGNYYL